MAVTNQRTIQVKKEKCDKSHLFTTNNLSSIDSAVKLLNKKGSLLLYIYLAKNQDNYTFDLSRKHFVEWCGVSDDTYKEAFKDLVNKGFIELIEPYNKLNPHYIFKDKVEITNVK